MTYKPKWEKVLYKEQPYATNYMEHDKKQATHVVLDYNSINKFVISVTSSCLFFCLSYIMQSVRSDILINFVFAVVLLFAYICIADMYKLKTFLKLSSIIIFWIYLISPIILTLTKEVETDTIYLCFALLQLAYTIDNVKCDILEDNSYLQARYKHELHMSASKKHSKCKSLDLGDTYTNYRRHNISIFGFCCTVLGSILLCSRYKSVDDVFLYLSTNLSWFILFPYYRSKLMLDKNTCFTVLFVLLCAIATKLVNTTFFVSYVIFVSSVYATTMAVMHMTKQK